MHSIPISKNLKPELLSKFQESYIILKCLSSRRFTIKSSDLELVTRANTFLTLLGLERSYNFTELIRDMINAHPNIYVSNNPNIQDFNYSTIDTNHIINPPKLTTDNITFNFGKNVYTPVTKKDLYLDNFEVNAEPLPRKLFHIDKDDPANYDHEAQIRYSKNVVFTRQVRMRSLSPFQSLVHAIYSYRCEDCAINCCDPIKENFSSCFCFIKSPALRTVFEFIQPDKGLPFRFDQKFSTVHRNPAYDKISSLVPSLFMVLIELTRNVGLNLINIALEGHITKLWLDYSKTSLYGSMMDEKSKFEAPSEHLLRNTDLIFYKISNAGKLIGTNRLGTDDEFDKTQLQYLIDRGYSNNILNKLDDSQGRWLYSSIQCMRTISSIIHAPTVLGVRYSGEGTPGSGSVAHMKPSKYIQIGTDFIPIRYRFLDNDIAKIHDRIYSNILAKAPNLTNIQTDFIESSTSNSAGLAPDTQKTLKDLLKQQYSSSWSPEELKELEGIVNVRLIDVINTISSDFISPETYSTALNRPQVAGERHQIDRRARIIQMVPTVHMLGTYINLKVLDPVVKGSRFAMSGKTSNDIRDMNLVLRGTGSGVKCDSADVAGMDTSTYLPQKRISGVAVNKYLETIRDKNIKYFLGSDRDPSMRVKVNVRYVSEDNIVTEGLEEISVLEFVQAAELGPLSVTSRLRDGIYQDYVSTSTTVFQSGRYDTSVQHSVLLSTLFEIVSEEIKNDQEFIEFIGSVLGDDQFSCLVFKDGVIDDVLSDKASARVTELLNKMGYTVENVNSRYTGELLKLKGVAGAPSPYHSRIAIYTSERGEDYSRDILAKMMDINSVLRQLSGRVTNPDHTTVMTFIADMLLGYVNTTEVTFTSRTVDADKDDIDYKHDMDTNIISYFTKRAGYDTKHNIHVFRGLWFMFPRLMLPPVPVDWADSICALPSSSYHFNSPCKAYYLYQIHKSRDFTSNTLAPDYSEFTNIVNDKTHPNHQLLKRLSRSYGYMNAYQIYQMSYAHISHKLEHTLDLDMTKKLGIAFMYNVTKALQERPEYISPNTTPHLYSYITHMNIFLDKRRVMTALRAAADIRTEFGMTISSDIGYWNRLGQRIVQAIGKKKELEELPFYLFRALQTTISNTSFMPSQDFINYLSYGDFRINRKPLVLPNLRSVDVFETGYGCAIKPKSFSSLLVNIFGLPLIDAVSLFAIKDNISKETLVAGIQDSVFSIAAKIFTMKDGPTRGLELLSAALGLTPRASSDLSNALERFGPQFFAMPYTFDPSQFFFINGSYTGLLPNCISVTHDNAFSTRVQYAILFSLVTTYPELISTQNSLTFGPYLIRRIVPVR